MRSFFSCKPHAFIFIESLVYSVSTIAKHKEDTSKKDDLEQTLECLLWRLLMSQSCQYVNAPQGSCPVSVCGLSQVCPVPHICQCGVSQMLHIASCRDVADCTPRVTLASCMLQQHDALCPTIQVDTQQSVYASLLRKQSRDRTIFQKFQ